MGGLAWFRGAGQRFAGRFGQRVVAGKPGLVLRHGGTFLQAVQHIVAGARIRGRGQQQDAGARDYFGVHHSFNPSWLNCEGVCHPEAATA